MNTQVAKQTGLIILGAFLVMIPVVVGGLLYLGKDQPKIRSLADYAPLQSTQVFSDDGQLIGEFFNERRRVVPFEAMPKHVVHAFLAAEDASFYEHEGIDYFGIMRAMLKNLRPGSHNLQGASTITQQTVKTLVLGPERTLTRKVREAIMSRELEQLLEKDEILSIYLNQIYFGNGAWGVEQAAQTYFGKSVRQLDLGEGALLAASPKSPGHYNIKADPVAAKNRQAYVLDQMLAHNWATAQDVARAKAMPAPFPADPPPYLGKAPYYMDQVRRQLVDKFGEQRLFEGGLLVYTGLSAKMQSAADTALHQGLEDLARKQGYAGAPQRVEVDRFDRFRKALHDEFTNQLQRRRQYPSAPTPRRGYIWDLSNIGPAQLTDEMAVRRGVDLAPLADYQRVRGLVFKLDAVKHEAYVDLGSVTGRLPLQNMAWARRFSPKNATPAPKDPGEALKVGDIITVEVAPTNRKVRANDVEVVLIPEPKVEGALVAIEPQSRLVRALLGGYRNEAGAFNRATQAYRQPGSAFKPIVYASALSTDAITPASICPDSPVVIPDPWTHKLWKPENYEDGRYDGNITFRTALMRSKNTCSVRLMQKIGPEQAIATARALGISSRLPENLTLALGTGDVTPLELSNAYATIAAGGLFATPLFIRKVVDARGNLLEENHAETNEALTPQVAYVLTSMMRSVVDKGTARRALMLDRPLAGKTGTSQESRNVWFSGFSPGLVATVWEGFDNNDSLGWETGASAALPTWIRFMGAALAAEPPHEFAVPDNITTVRINPVNGLLSDAPDAIDEVFVSGTEPTTQNEALPSLFMEDDQNQMHGKLPD